MQKSKVLRNKNHVYDRKSVIKRIGIYFAAVIILAAFQCSFFARISPFGATPDLILGLVCAVCLLEKKEVSLVFSVSAGFVIDSVGGSGVSFTPLLFLSLAIFLTYFAKKLMPKFLPYIFLLAPAAFVNSVFTGLRIYLLSSQVSAVAVLTKIILPGFMSTFIFAMPLYFLIKLCLRFINAKTKFKI